MQSKDEFGQVKQLEQVDLGNVEKLVQQIKSAEEKGAVSHAIGKFPKAGHNIEILGLSYRVEFADFVRGKFTVKLVCRDK